MSPRPLTVIALSVALLLAAMPLVSHQDNIHSHAWQGTVPNEVLGGTRANLTAYIDVVTPSGSVKQREWVYLAGHGTSDNSSVQIINYSWVFVHLPSKYTFVLMDDSYNVTYVPFNLTGQWRIEFYVWGSDGSVSPPAVTTIECVPWAGAPTAYIDEISPNPAAVGETVRFKGHGIDIGGVVIAYAWFSDIDGIIDLGPSANDVTNSSLSPGRHNISFMTVDYQYNQSELVNETLIVEYRPVLLSYDPQPAVFDAYVGDQVVFNISAVDSDYGIRPEFANLAVTWYINGNPVAPGSYTVEEENGYTNSTFALTVPSSMVGQNTVKVVVSDSYLNASYEWHPSIQWRNERPVIDSFYPTEDSFTIHARDTKTFSVNVSDADPGDLNNISITWSIDGEDTGVTGPKFTYTPTEDDIGTHTINVTVEDWKGGLTGHEWGVTVDERPNLPPEISNVVPDNTTTVTMNEGEYLEFRVYATDPEQPEYPQALTYRWYVSGEHIESADNVSAYYFQTTFTGMFSSVSSPYTILVEISDGVNTVEVSWIVEVVDVNRPPVAVIDSPTSDGTYYSDEFITFSCMNTTDPDNDVLEITWTSSIDGIVYNGSSMSVTEKLSPGEHIITLQVYDGKVYNETSVTIVVQEPPPDIDLDASIELSKYSAKPGDTVSIRVQVVNHGSDPAEDVVVELLNNGVPQAQEYLGTVTKGHDGEVVFNWVVLDQQNLSVKIGDKSFDVPPITVDTGTGNPGDTGNPGESNNSESNASSPFATLTDDPTVLGIVVIVVLLVLILIAVLNVRTKRKKRKKGKKKKGRYREKEELSELDTFAEDFSHVGYGEAATMQPAGGYGAVAQTYAQQQQAAQPAAQAPELSYDTTPTAAPVENVDNREEEAGSQQRRVVSNRPVKVPASRAAQPSTAQLPSIEELALPDSGDVGDLDSLLDNIFLGGGMPPMEESGTEGEDLESLLDELGFKDEHITIHCPKCKANIVVDYTIDDPISVKCNNCGARGRIRNPWKNKKKSSGGSDLDGDIDNMLGDLFAK